MKKLNKNDKFKVGESRQIKKVVFFFIAIIFISSASATFAAELLIKDDFESGSYSNEWSEVYEFGEITTVHPCLGGGQYSARGNHYPEDIDMRFHFQLPNYKEIDILYIRYYIFYEDSPAYQWGGDANVKFMRLIGPDWGLQTEFEFMSTSEFRVASYGASGTQGTTYAQRDYTNGTWVKVAVLLMYDIPGENNGTLKVWFNDELVLNMERNYSWRGSSSEKYEAVRIPCIRGAGTSMTHDNFWQIDNIEIWNGMPDQEPQDSTAPSPPSNLYVTESKAQ